MIESFWCGPASCMECQDSVIPRGGGVEKRESEIPSAGAEGWGPWAVETPRRLKESFTAVNTLAAVLPLSQSDYSTTPDLEVVYTPPTVSVNYSTTV